MDIPDRCTVLVVGGGPGGSYAASVLAREGIDTVLLEADKFPRYHIGESLLRTTGSFLEFVDAYDKFESHGFRQKNGAAFKFNSKPAAYSNFLRHGQHAWNVDRSQCDDLMFKHARECGARTFDGVKVQSVEFWQTFCQDEKESGEQAHLGKPVSASWVRKDKTTGSIKFQYLVDASGRAGLISTKYMKNHGSGWVWFIPLGENKVSVGVVMEQKSATAKKKLMESPSSREWLLTQAKEAPGIGDLLAKATLVSDVKSASDWSYTASTYASTNIRIVGDAGCFIDPLFSSGIHLALTGAFSAAATICSSIRGDCSEKTAADWHSKRIQEAYARFLLVVASTYGQITGKEAAILNDEGESDFDSAFELIRPIIQGSAEESTGKAGPEDATEAVAFCMRVIQKAQNRLEDISIGDKIIRAAMQPDTGSIGGSDIDGMVIHAERGALGLDSPHKMWSQVATRSHGFQFYSHESKLKDFLDEERIRAEYYPETEQLLHDVTGATRFCVFDHTVRQASQDWTTERDARGPVQRVHIDSSYAGAEARVRYHFPDEATELLKHRYQMISVWRPIKTILKDPLAVADAHSTPESDLFPVKIHFPDREVEGWAVKADPQLKWYYRYKQPPDMVTLIKLFDSKLDGRARRVPHTAFVNPATEHEAPRESIELRALIFHPDDPN
ncbi:hypothetical protein BDV41DRAFT_583681 [Aspergillus transmontanensis]|uniref:FAD-binding domain-containing protein n=1 Tax=Aspergillus transmontanensis TaxID=1034304 RepID=A0A5N6WHJ6_9EURO|nr:hypothetical protein BDV41DRAFT_583681 [Aspergillus transmontanensis]